MKSTDPTDAVSPSDHEAAGDEVVRVLVVDDERDVREMIAAVLDADARLEVVGSADDGNQAVELVETLQPHVVVMDVNMPRCDGCDATERILELHPDVRVVALSGRIEQESVTRMILAGAVGYAVKGSNPDILAQVVVNASRSARFIDAAAVPGLFDSVVRLAREERHGRAEAERLAHDLEQAYRETVMALVGAIKYRDTGTEEHGDRVADRVVAIGRRLGLSPRQMVDLEYGAVFHDIGKIAVPDAILHNEDDLTPAEWDVIKQHTVVGEQILKPVGFLQGVALIVRHSHEHYDGSGYPDGLVGDDIPIESRVVFACDAFDAMTSTRTYQQAMPIERAAARMLELSGSHFDPAVVNAMLHVLVEEGALAALPVAG